MRPLKTRLYDVRMYVKQRDGSDSSGRVVNERMFLGAGCWNMGLRPRLDPTEAFG